jgi:hypothetical protein
MTNYHNLDRAIHDAKFGSIENTCNTLNDSQIDDILSMIGKGCRARTKERLAFRLRVPLSLWKSYGIYSRMTLTEDSAEYICGQSWTDEMRTLRECILEN